MRIKARMALLLLLLAGAVYTGAEAAGSLQRGVEGLPGEIYEQYAVHAASAQYYLRPSQGRVAVFPGKKAREPEQITGIELKNLRKADRAMLEAGLPVQDRDMLLRLLEDLGS